MNNKCPRTGRLCVGGAYDGGDGAGQPEVTISGGGHSGKRDIREA